MRRIALALLILAGSTGAGLSGDLSAIDPTGPAAAEKISFQANTEDPGLELFKRLPGRDRPAMSTREDATRLAYGCQPGYYICHARSRDICCPNGSSCSVEGYCY